MTDATLPAPDDGAGFLLGVPQMARLLGMRPDDVRAQCEAGELPAFRHGRREWRVTRSTLERFLHDKAIAETEARREARKPIPARGRGRPARAAPML